MKIRINFFAEPSEPNVEPSLIACPTGDFASLEEARPIALADGNKPAIMAHSATYLLEAKSRRFPSLADPKHGMRKGASP